MNRAIWQLIDPIVCRKTRIRDYHYRFETIREIHTKLCHTTAKAIDWSVTLTKALHYKKAKNKISMSFRGDFDRSEFFASSACFVLVFNLSLTLWQAGLHGFLLRYWTCLGGWENVPFVALLVFLSLLPIDLANCCQFCMALTQSCYVTEGFGMVLLPLLRLLYDPWPVATIRRPTAWLRHWILASTLAYTTYTSCVTYWTVILFVTSLYTC